MEKKPLIILTGPTAVGKTGLSVRLASQIGAEIISADSMQVYRRMDIGSAKIMPEEMQGIPHYLLDVLDPEEDFNVVRFQTLAREAMERIRANGKIPMVVGARDSISRRCSMILILRKMTAIRLSGRCLSTGRPPEKERSCTGCFRPATRRRRSRSIPIMSSG